MSLAPPDRRDLARPVLPVSTYRLQLQASFDLRDALGVVDYVADLGISHLYLSPVLQAAPGSTHGYDVVDHSRVSTELGGREALAELAAAAHGRGMGIVVDVVPNHMAVPTPLWHNRVMWSILRDGPGSPFAPWLDIDWGVADRAVLMPILGERIGQVLDAGDFRLDTADLPTGEDGAVVTEQVLRYFDHVLPVRAGTGDLPLPQLIDRQWYRLAHWRVADEELNYRRFFDIDTLAAVRVELPEVFDATHDVLVGLFRDGIVDGFRIDHPDGLADPRGYVRRLVEATTEPGRRPWVVVEKILEGDEQLPADWPCDGTTGYDVLRHITGLFTNPFAAADLHSLYVELAGDEAAVFDQVAETGKRDVIGGGQYAEVERLVDLLVGICHEDIHLRDHTRRGLHEAVVELLVAMDRYRAYVVPGETPPAESVEVVAAAAARARERLADERHDTLAVVVDLVLGGGTPLSDTEDLRSTGDAARRRELVVRFQQTCGPVMAKGVEDTAFYRWHRLIALNEVGGDPSRVGVPTEEVHAFAADIVSARPATMSTLTTHDTKRSEDARAQLLGATHDPRAWTDAVRSWHEAAAGYRSREGWPDGGTEYLFWQTLVAAWPITGDRLLPYMEKAVREAKLFTSWTVPDETYESGVRRFVEDVLADQAITTDVADHLGRMRSAIRAVVLGQKLTQLVMPGVPDVYQGTELVTLSLVDPDNRRAVDYEQRRLRLARLDAGGEPADLDDEKLLVTSRALRLRRELPDAFRGPASHYWALATSSGNAVGFVRGYAPPRLEPDAPGSHADGRAAVVAIVSRQLADLDHNGGWADHVAYLPQGRWHDELTGRVVDGGEIRLANTLDRYPVALLRRVT